MRELRLPPSLATSLASGHPWVYRDHVGDFRASSGTWVRVVAGSYQGVGLWDAEGAIAVRLFSSGPAVDQEWVTARVREAWQLRASVRNSGVTGYRLIFGEADQLPGIVVDLYGEYAILVSYSKSLGQLLPWVARAVVEVAAVVGVTRRAKQDGQVQLTLLCGELAPEELIVEELGMRLVAELTRGQKTGLFFDHRDNRHYVRSLSSGARVLNLFSYTGGFSVAAALGGARSVRSVDISRPAVEASERNFALNGLASFPHEAIAADVFDQIELLLSQNARFDLIVCDPPSFAKNRAQLKAAEKAYRKLMSRALELVEDGGLFCAASCTSQIGPSAFRLALVDAARKARKRLRIVRDAGHPTDHPIAVAHEEGRYLKFLAVRVHSRC